VRAAFLFVACGVFACGREEDVDFARDVAPIVERECIGCHVTGGIAPFALTSHADVRAHAAEIRAVTADRTMPPYGVDNSGACNTYVSPRWLSDQEIDTIGRWVEQGAPGLELERANDVAPPPPAIAPTVTIDPGAEWTPPAMPSDVYRCFIVDPAISEDHFLSAYEVVPGNARIVHHVILFSVDTEEAERAVDALDEREPGPGYTCFGGSLLDLRSSRAIAAWAPGTGVTRFPEASGVRIRGGRRMILQVHYNTKNGVAPDRTRVHLELARGVDRIAEILGVANLGIELPPGLASFTPEPVRIAPGVGGFIRGVYPHMHKLGIRLSAKVLHTGGRETCLTVAPAYDFDWQQFYFLTRAVYVSSTDRVELSCEYDTRSRSETVRWGEGTDEEMCLLGLYVTLN
jgi:hypothetical protein